MRERLIRVVLFLVVAPALGHARKGQEFWENLKELQVGQKTEVVDMTMKSLRGTFVSFSEEAISLRTRKGDVTVRRPDVLRISLREHSKRKRNVLIGAAIGAGVGAALSVMMIPYCRNEGASCLELFGARLVPVFSGIGAGAGALSPGYRTIYSSKRRRGSQNP